MEEKGVWLLCEFKGEKFDVRIKDVDEINIFDLFIDVEQQAEKQLPMIVKNPRLKYYDPFRDCLAEIDGDQPLQDMLVLYDGEDEIDVLVEDSDEPCAALVMARNLRDGKGYENANVQANAGFDEDEVNPSDDEELDETYDPPEDSHEEDRAASDLEDQPLAVQVPAVDAETGNAIYVDKPPTPPPRRKFRRLRSTAKDVDGANQRYEGAEQMDSQPDKQDQQTDQHDQKRSDANTEANPSDFSEAATPTKQGHPPRRREKHLGYSSPMAKKGRQAAPKIDTPSSSATSTSLDEEADASTDHANCHYEEQSQPQCSGNVATDQEVPQSQHFVEPSSPPPFSQPPQAEEEGNGDARASPHVNASDLEVPEIRLHPKRKLTTITKWRIKKGILPPRDGDTSGANEQQRDEERNVTGRHKAPRRAAASCPYYENVDGGGTGSSSSDDSSFNVDSDEEEQSDTSLDEEQASEENNMWEVNEEDDYKISYDSSEDEMYTDRMYKNGQFYMHKPFGSIQLKKGDIFIDRQDFIDVVSDYCVQEQFDLVKVKNDQIRFTSECATEGCPWRIHCSRLSDGYSWQVKTIREEHTCCKVMENKMANCGWLARHFMTDVKANPDIPGAAIVRLALERYGLKVKQSLAFKVRDYCKREIEGAYDESYAKLPHYMEVIMATNPGTFTNLPWPSQPPYQFSKCFIAFEAALHGFKTGCRPLIGMDGCHLKGYYGGVLLAAVALDANQEIFPLAYAVVGKETKETWTYFLQCLRLVIGDGGGRTWTFISDRQKGIDPALDVVFPNCPRRICVRHLMKNFKKNFPAPGLLEQYWRACKATSVYIFDKAMAKMKAIDVEAYNYLMDIPLETWSMHKFDPSVVNCEATSNFVESFNSKIGIHRAKPIYALLEGIRITNMIRHCERRDKARQMKDHELCPRIRKRLKVISEESEECVVTTGGDGEFEVVQGRATLSVNLKTRECICGRWQITGIPCKHAHRCITACGQDPASYCHSYYTGKRYKKCYEHILHPVPSQEYWPTNNDHPDLAHPTVTRGVGRPARNRRREEGEQQRHKRVTTIKCTLCGETGHNRRSCQGGLTKAEKKAKKAASKVDTSHQATSSTQTQTTPGEEGNESSHQQHQTRKSSRNKGKAKVNY